MKPIPFQFLPGGFIYAVIAAVIVVAAALVRYRIKAVPLITLPIWILEIGFGFHGLANARSDKSGLAVPLDLGAIFIGNVGSILCLVFFFRKLRTAPLPRPLKLIPRWAEVLLMRFMGFTFALAFAGITTSVFASQASFERFNSGLIKTVQTSDRMNATNKKEFIAELSSKATSQSPLLWAMVGGTLFCVVLLLLFIAKAPALVSWGEKRNKNLRERGTAIPWPRSGTIGVVAIGGFMQVIVVPLSMLAFDGMPTNRPFPIARFVPFLCIHLVLISAYSIAGYYFVKMLHGQHDPDQPIPELMGQGPALQTP